MTKKQSKTKTAKRKRNPDDYTVVKIYKNDKPVAQLTKDKTPLWLVAVYDDGWKFPYLNLKFEYLSSAIRRLEEDRYI